MTMFFLALKIGALLGSILLPLTGPKKEKKIRATSPKMSSLYVNEDGCLEYYVKPVSGASAKY